MTVICSGSISNCVCNHIYFSFVYPVCVFIALGNRKCAELMVKRIDPAPIIDKEFLVFWASTFACVCLRFSIHWASHVAFFWLRLRIWSSELRSFISLAAWVKKAETVYIWSCRISCRGVAFAVCGPGERKHKRQSSELSRSCFFHPDGSQNANLARKRTTTYSLSQSTKHTLGQLCAPTLARSACGLKTLPRFILCAGRAAAKILIWQTKKCWPPLHFFRLPNSCT